MGWSISVLKICLDHSALCCWRFSQFPATTEGDHCQARLVHSYKIDGTMYFLILFAFSRQSTMKTERAASLPGTRVWLLRLNVFLLPVRLSISPLDACDCQLSCFLVNHLCVDLLLSVLIPVIVNGDTGSD